MPPGSAVVLHRTGVVSAAAFLFFFIAIAESSNNSQVGCSKTCVEENCNTIGIRYGKFCGVGWTGCPGEKPCDDLDACCKIHDECVERNGKWWERFGSKTPELTRFAIRVLSLTCSASGCERNWSTFELIHTKRRNRLEHKRLNALVFGKYNLKLRERSIRRRDIVDPIVVDAIESDDEWITEKEDPVLPESTKWLEDDELFEGDPIVRVPPGDFDSLLDSDKRVEDIENVVELPRTVSKKRVGETSSMTNIKCHEKFKRCIKKVHKSGKEGFSKSCPYDTAVPTMVQGMDMAILFSQLGGPKTEL